MINFGFYGVTSYQIFSQHQFTKPGMLLPCCPLLLILGDRGIVDTSWFFKKRDHTRLLQQGSATQLLWESLDGFSLGRFFCGSKQNVCQPAANLYQPLPTSSHQQQQKCKSSGCSRGTSMAVASSQLNLCCFVLGLWRFAAVVYEKSSGSKVHLKDDIAKANIKESHGMSQCDEHQSHSNSNHPINQFFVLYHIFHHDFHPWSSHSP